MPEWRPNHPKSGKSDTQGLPLAGAFNRLILALTYALSLDPLLLDAIARCSARSLARNACF
jgi:hypothetical protein